jgi:hypothetical protein
VINEAVVLLDEELKALGARISLAALELRQLRAMRDVKRKQKTQIEFERRIAA